MKLSKLRQSGVPLCLYETSDPAAKVVELRKQLNGKNEDYVLLEFDVIQGLRGLNDGGKRWVKQNGPEEGMSFRITDWFAKLIDPDLLGQPGVVFWHKPEWQAIEVVQAVALLRNVFKASEWTWVGLDLTANLPAPLRQDVVVVPEILPGPEDLTEIVLEIMESARSAGAKIEDAKPDAYVSALLGLNAFASEQALALALDPEKGIDVNAVWKHKLATIKATAGCEIVIDNPGFEAVEGLENIKEFLLAFNAGRLAPRCIVLADEVDRMFMGEKTDSSGVKGSMTQLFLGWTQDKRVKGVLMHGVPGAGKTAIAKAMAGNARCPLFKLNLGEIQNSLVGESEANLRRAFNAIEAISQGRIFLIGTSNAGAALSDGVSRRFGFDTPYFFDYPTAKESAAIWGLYMRKYELSGDVPNTPNWVGSEIENACEKAWCLNQPLEQVVKRFIPQCVSRKAQIEEMRNKASGKYLSASYPGMFLADRMDTETETKKRAFKLG